jgi:hypothetical protein
VGAAFPAFKDAARWRSLGTRILAEQLDRQVSADGVHFEQSTYYHRYTADFYLHALLLAQATEPSLERVVRPRLHRLLDYLLFITRPDGTSPLIGDEDGGRLVMLGRRPTNDFRDTLAIGAALLGRGDCAFVAAKSVGELSWLLGPPGLRAYDALSPAPPATTSRAFAESGYYVMRDGWDNTADCALVRCGPHGSQVGAHAHADALALELSLSGHPVLIDAGTYCYTASREEREQFRGTAAHNTVTVDERSSAEPGRSVFKWQSVPRSRATAWVTTARFDFFEGEHDGYHRLASPATHSRAVFLLKGEYCVIRDRIRSAGEHRIALRFHWPPGATLSAKSHNILEVLLAEASAPRVEARIFARYGDHLCEDGWVSPAYAVRTPAPVSLFRLDAAGSEDIVTVITSSPSSLRLQESEWRASDQEAGTLTLALASGSDTILTGPTSDAAHNDVVSDAAWTWVRRSPAGDPLAFVLVRGSHLTIDEYRAFHADRMVSYVIGRRDGDNWRIELESPTRMLTSPLCTTTGIQESCVASVE